MDPNATGYPALQQQQHHTGYPVTTQSPHGQLPFYPNPMPPFPQSKTPSQQQQQQHSFGAVPMQQPGGPGGAMMPSGFPQHPSGPHANFSAPPFAQPPVPTTMSQFLPPQGTSTSSIPTTAAHAFPQNMASVSANNMLPAQQRPVQLQQPPQPQPQAQPQPNPAQAEPQGPAAAREKARVATLLDINSMLLEEVVNLRAAGKAGGPPVPQDGSPAADPEAAKGPVQKPSPEYIECMRRLQANLAYLATIADRAKKSGGVPPPGPAIMTPPPNMSSMNEIYSKLNELFPRTAKSAAGTPQPSPQGMQGNGNPSPSPAAESVV
ncbi:hypothetical protein ASPWEDRAFT_166284 [Aspergillus wentii DTO 134E9]|uniref:Uncharacterized protein n=1 Tax=Aspergillus wentii DTO 134E9 TaxID=1073089 RepID=A0A1L9RZ26_ASPWE|nr:uncharacterized protein ASPWEDRAFT_166284 [Aspergillus wentii DTO 134E9]KAI9932629.1 hypothetical protein MW887_008877 [Aspergillus wentii]OJJ40201.1 hypothetical protein ASPWEDRAFT_166284 [Aspergillus wentii DTO 134E9]